VGYVRVQVEQNLFDGDGVYIFEDDAVGEIGSVAGRGFGELQCHQECATGQVYGPRWRVGS
jgi:hypothetical protein